MINVGDFVEYVGNSVPGSLTKGSVYKVLYLHSTVGALEIRDDSGLAFSWVTSDFKFYARGPLLPKGTGQDLLPNFTADNMYDQVQPALTDLIETLTTQRKKEGLCPNCGGKGHFHHLALVCDEHGEY